MISAQTMFFVWLNRKRGQSLGSALGEPLAMYVGCSKQVQAVNFAAMESGECSYKTPMRNLYKSHARTLDPQGQPPNHRGLVIKGI